MLKNQEEECDRLAGALYSKGLTQSQVGDIFDEIYGEHYSKSSISRLASVRPSSGVEMSPALILQPHRLCFEFVLQPFGPTFPRACFNPVNITFEQLRFKHATIVDFGDFSYI